MCIASWNNWRRRGEWSEVPELPYLTTISGKEFIQLKLPRAWSILEQILFKPSSLFDHKKMTLSLERVKRQIRHNFLHILNLIWRDWSIVYPVIRAVDRVKIPHKEARGVKSMSTKPILKIFFLSHYVEPINEHYVDINTFLRDPDCGCNKLVVHF